MAGEPPPAAEKGDFFLGECGFSVYEEMGRHLKALQWRCRTAVKAAAKCDLVLGDRFQIPYGELRCAPLPSSSFFGGTRWVNYFKGSHKLTQKAAMAELLRAADTTCGEWMPQSFVLGGAQDRAADEREAFLQSVSASPASVWIIKPSSGAKGEEIVIVRGFDEAEEFVRVHLESKPSTKKRYVVQRYVERPLLLSHGRKFDVRVWALLTSPYRIHAFTQGSCRTASVPFSLDDTHNVQAHLTNHCLQEGSEEFGRFEPGNELWFPQLEEYLVRGLGKPPGTLVDVVLPQMANIMVRSLLSMKSQMEVFPSEPFRCFQLFGYDFIIEESLVVKLLEINGSPGVAERYLPVVVDCILDLLGCTSPASPKVDTAKRGKGKETSRHWDIDGEGFALLWQDGDPIPEGLTID